MSRVSCTGSRVSWTRGGVSFHLSLVAGVDFDTFGEYNVSWKSGFVEEKTVNERAFGGAHAESPFTVGHFSKSAKV